MPEDWPDFQTRLAQVLTDLTGGPGPVVLIIMDGSEPGAMVQYICGGDEGGTWAEVASNRFLPKHRRLTKDDEQLLISAGWAKPGGRWRSSDRPPNWHTDRFTDPAADHAPLAEMSVRALRDALRIPAPSALMYKAFDQESGTPRTLPLNLPQEPE